MKKHSYEIEKFMHGFNLKLDELHVYALVHTFSMNNGRKGNFSGTANFVQFKTGVPIKSVEKILKALEKKQLIKTVVTNEKSEYKKYVTLASRTPRKKEEKEDASN